MSRTGLFGGSFNPVHIAHLIVAERVREEAELDRIVFVPARRPPHKPNRPLASGRHRIQMLERAIEDHPHFEISTAELNREGPSYTLRTVRVFRDQMSEEGELCLLLGGDSVLDLPNWWRADELVKEVSLIAVERPGYLLDDLSVVRDAFGEGVVSHIRQNRVQIPLLELSATNIRKRRREGFSIRYLVPESVRTYIHEHGLFVDSPPS
jgi:nicotinate-nucleotide adenylyltransferase